MAEALADFERGGEALDGKFALPKLVVGDPAEVETVGLSPGVLAIGMFGAVESVAGVSESFARVAGGEESFGEGEAEID